MSLVPPAGEPRLCSSTGPRWLGERPVRGSRRAFRLDPSCSMSTRFGDGPLKEEKCPRGAAYWLS